MRKTKSGYFKNKLFKCLYNCYGAIFELLSLFLFYIFGKGEVCNKSNLPNTSFILVANHVSFADWLALYVVFKYSLKRTVTFVAKKYLFFHPCWKMLMYHVGCICVNQDKVNKDFLKASCSTLKKPYSILGIFPEGKRSEDGTIKKGYDGAVRLAILTNTPVVPVGLIGFYQLWSKGKLLPTRSKLTINIGRPLYFSKKISKKI